MGGDFDFQGRVTLRNDIPPLVTVSPLSLLLTLIHFSPRREQSKHGQLTYVCHRPVVSLMVADT
jgi:hypothetical protein